MVFRVLVTQVQGLVTEDWSQPSRRPETGAESATHEDTGTCQDQGRGEVRVRQPGDGGHGAITTKVLGVDIMQRYLHLVQKMVGSGKL